MKSKFLIPFFVLGILTKAAFGQVNLVPNPSFEIVDTCIEFYTMLNSDNTVKYWSSPTSGTPDYFSTICGLSPNNSVPMNWAGYQNAHSGISYAGIYAFANRQDSST